MGPPLLLTAALSRHGYADSWCTNLRVIALWLIHVVVVKVVGLVVIDGCLVVICVIGRGVVVAIQDIFTGFAHSQVAWLRKELARDNGRALGVKNLTTGATVVLPAKGRERIAAVEAVFCVLISHPKFPIQYLSTHLSEGAAR